MEAYEERFGWDRRTLGTVALCAVFVGLASLPGMPVVMRVLVYALFGVGGLVMVFVAFSRKVALRVDERGVLLGGSPLRYSATTARVRWNTIEAVVLWEQRLRHTRMLYVGLARLPGSPPLPGPGRGLDPPIVGARSVGHVPPEVLAASVCVNGWRLDEARLAAAVARFAPPGVRVIDTRGK
ncbi:hypothetical protein GCM10027160_34060 [Streptomyces calidiresistens]